MVGHISSAFCAWAFVEVRRVIPDRHVQDLLERAVEHAAIIDHTGQPLRALHAAQLRRFFATEPIAGGLPLPILAKLWDT